MQNVSSHDNSRANNIVSNSSTTEDNVYSNVPPNAKHDDSHSHISSQDSFVVVSPKPSKLLNPHMISNSPVNKDVGAPSISSNNQTAFRKPGCFQAVPVTIPGVHSSVRKKEMVQNQQKAQFSSDEDVKNHSSNIQNAENISEQKNKSHMETKESHLPAESSKQSGFVGKIINQINSSSETDRSTPPPDTKNLASHHQPNSPAHNARSESQKLDHNSSSAKPGFPMKVASNQSFDPSQLAKDVPPDLPKKEKRSQLNAAFSSEPNKLMHQTQNLSRDPKKIPNEKLSNSVPLAASKDHMKHTPSVSEQSKILQNKIAMENSKNSKIDNSNSHSPNTKHSKPDVLKKNDHESNKLCSTDKRFQKVLPPLDKSFALKPTSTRKGVNQNDASDHSSGNSDYQNVQKTNRIVESVPPSIPPKVNMHQTNAHYSEKNSNEPPKIPPKKSNLASKNLHSSQTSKEKALNRDNAAKLPSENHPQVKASHVNEESVSKLNVDIVEVKDSNNEKNNQLQKGNMPDLISKMIPHEKNELILKEENKIENSKNEKEDPNNKNSSFNKEINNHEYDVPESPKSPRRQSWFFGTHKNSLVVSFVCIYNIF